MTTALQLVNKVLRRLRESEVSDFSEAYPRLILDFINETKREVENSWNWTMLRTTKDINTVSGTRQYALTGAGNGYRILKDYRNRDMVWDITNKHQLLNSNVGVVMEDSLATTLAQPSYFRIYGQNSSGDPYVDFASIPSGSYIIRFHLFIPQADLSDINDVLTVPDYPVVIGAYARAIRERGEDEGLAGGEVFSLYQNALADEISKDESRVVGETEWYG